jgi:hypothetical protein
VFPVRCELNLDIYLRAGLVFILESHRVSSKVGPKILVYF